MTFMSCTEPLSSRTHWRTLLLSLTIPAQQETHYSHTLETRSYHSTQLPFFIRSNSYQMTLSRPKQLMPFMFGRNKRMHVGGSYLHGLIQLLSLLNAKMELIVSFSPIVVKFDSTCRTGHQIAQACVVFEIPSKHHPRVFLPSGPMPPTHLVYIEWFSPPSVAQNSSHGLYKVSRLMKDGKRQASILLVSSIISSVHLLPRFGQSDQQGMNSFTVLEKWDSFYVNPFSDINNFMLFS